MQELIEIQKLLKANKGQRNNFGNYNYRSCEDILEAVKPLCVDRGVLLTLSDKIVLVGDRVYVEATATIQKGDKSIPVTAYAREAESKKGMDVSQITGSASSYARKYALNGLFCIDDTKDADTRDNSCNPKESTSKKYKREIKSAPEQESTPHESFENHNTITEEQKKGLNEIRKHYATKNDADGLKFLERIKTKESAARAIESFNIKKAKHVFAAEYEQDETVSGKQAQEEIF